MVVVRWKIKWDNTSLVKKTAVKKGTIAAGKRVTVAWGKSKKTYQAEVVSVSGTQTPVAPTASRIEEEVFTPAPQSSRVTSGHGVPSENSQPHHQQLLAILEKIESLSDAVSGVEARLLSRLDALEGKVTELKKEVEKCAPPAEGTLVQNPMPMPLPIPIPYFEGSPSEFFGSPPPPLQDRTNCDFGGTDSIIPQEDLRAALNACRSRRNLAARLTLRLFTPQERAGSNCRGVLGKRLLHRAKVAAIFSAAMKYFPLQPLETSTMAEKEMRNAVDECCRKTKLPVPQNENICP